MTIDSALRPRGKFDMHCGSEYWSRLDVVRFRLGLRDWGFVANGTRTHFEVESLQVFGYDVHWK